MQTQTPVLDHTFSTRQAFIAFAKAENRAFMESHGGRIVIEYVRESLPRQLGDNPREKRRGKPTGVLVAFRANDGTLRLGWSAAHSGGRRKRPDNFDKTIGLWKAIRRATGQARSSGKIPDRLINKDCWDQSTGLMAPAYTSDVSTFLRRAAEKLGAKY